MPAAANKRQPAKTPQPQNGKAVRTITKPHPLNSLHPSERKKAFLAPLWKGPAEDGITFSLLSKFLVCRERFRLRVVEGLVEDMGFNHAIEFGSMWHEAEEGLAASAGKNFTGKNAEEMKSAIWYGKLAKYKNKLLSQYTGADERQIIKWFEIAKRQFPLYAEHWRKHPDEKSRKPILEEVAFRVPYTLPSGRTVLLRGKWDAVMLLDRPAKGSDPALYAAWVEHWPNAKCGIVNQENKTKGNIDEDGLLRTIFGNLQTMLYHFALRQFCSAEAIDIVDAREHGKYRKLIEAVQYGYPITGVLYNVVRRPLSDRYAPKQKKGETEKQFYDRVASKISDDPRHWFMRWRCILSPTDIERFQQQVFNPILEQLCDWWEWIQVDPHDPWRPRTEKEFKPWGAWEADGPVPNHIHWQAPWGVYDSLASGFRGDYFEYLTRGHTVGLQKIKSLFPELDATK